VALLEDAAANGNGSSPVRGTRRHHRLDAAWSSNEANERILRSSPERRPPRDVPATTRRRPSAMAVDSRRNQQGLISPRHSSYFLMAASRLLLTGVVHAPSAASLA